MLMFWPICKILSNHYYIITVVAVMSQTTSIFKLHLISTHLWWLCGCIFNKWSNIKYVLYWFIFHYKRKVIKMIINRREKEGWNCSDTTWSRLHSSPVNVTQLTCEKFVSQSLLARTKLVSNKFPPFVLSGRNFNQWWLLMTASRTSSSGTDTVSTVCSDTDTKDII